MILRATRSGRPLNPALRAGKAGIAAWIAASLGAHALALSALVAWDRTPDHPPVPYLPVEIVVEQASVEEAVSETKHSILSSDTSFPPMPEKPTVRPTAQNPVIPAERQSRAEPEPRATERVADSEKPLNPECAQPPCAGPGSRITALGAVSGMTGVVVPKPEGMTEQAVSKPEQPSPSPDRPTPARPPVPRSRPETPPILVAVSKRKEQKADQSAIQKSAKLSIVPAAAPTASPPDKPTGVIATDPGPEKRAVLASADATAGVTRPPAVDGGAANAPPAYPYLARERGWEGRVVLRVAVDAAGRARDVTVDKGSGRAILDRAAADAVRKWRFRPAKHAGQAVAGVVKVPILFRLQNE